MRNEVLKYVLEKKELGTEVILTPQEAEYKFPAPEGTINLYYGRIGGGKTYNATADLLDDLANGNVVYCNWHVIYKGYDERSRGFWRHILNILFFHKRYYEFKHENLHYIEVEDEKFWEVFESATDSIWYLDEATEILDSYQGTKMNLQKRKAINRTRHLNRTINLIAQRPTAVHVTARAMVNRFYRCEKLLSWPFVVFRRTEFQDMFNETVDEDSKPISSKWYKASNRVFSAYNSYYLRGGIEKSQQIFVSAYDLSFYERLKAFYASLKADSPLAFKRAGAEKRDVTTAFDSGTDSVQEKVSVANVRSASVGFQPSPSLTSSVPAFRIPVKHDISSRIFEPTEIRETR